jgi:hypothetical protein
MQSANPVFIFLLMTAARGVLSGHCPNDPAPCTCESLSESGDRLKFNCANVETAAAAKEAFARATVDDAVTWEFYASNCSWSSLPDNFFSGHSVEKIDIQECELASVSTAAVQSVAPKLKDIRLMSNQLASFPFDLEMPELDTLILYDNRFATFPKLNYPNLRYQRGQMWLFLCCHQMCLKSMQKPIAVLWRLL